MIIYKVIYIYIYSYNNNKIIARCMERSNINHFSMESEKSEKGNSKFLFSLHLYVC